MEVFNMKLTICLLCIIIMVSANSPPKNKWQKTKGEDLLDELWRKGISGDAKINNIILDHQTRSDAMQLYSIQAKQIVKIGEIASSATWDPKYELSLEPKSRSRRDNKFVTETVSYQRLKIKSADNKKYLCAKTNGEIVFKENADKEDNLAIGSSAYLDKADKNNKPRKRCLFHWEFTDQMHIKLSLEAGDKKRFYLSVKDDVISLREMKDSTELERSFIWLPTKPATTRIRKHNTKKFQRKIGRSFVDSTKKPTYCEAKVYFQHEKLKYYKNKLESLEAEIQRLKKERRDV